MTTKVRWAVSVKRTGRMLFVESPWIEMEEVEEGRGYTHMEAYRRDRNIQIWKPVYKE